MTLSRNETYDITSFTCAVFLGGTKEMNSTCAKMTHMGMKDRGSIVLNLLVTYMKNWLSEWLLFPYFMLGYVSASPVSVKP